jgi:hypothetical protein
MLAAVLLVVAAGIAVMVAWPDTVNAAFENLSAWLKYRPRRI